MDAVVQNGQSVRFENGDAAARFFFLRKISSQKLNFALVMLWIAFLVFPLSSSLPNHTSMVSTCMSDVKRIEHHILQYISHTLSLSLSLSLSLFNWCGMNKVKSALSLFVFVRSVSDSRPTKAFELSSVWRKRRGKIDPFLNGFV
jgi:hypothetical protein